MATKKKAAVKKAKALTKTQRTRMAKDRANELCCALGLEEIEDDAFEAAQALLLELYDADIESGKELA